MNTWRPAGSRILDKMKRFFTGGAPEIDDVSYVAIPKDFKVYVIVDSIQTDPTLGITL